MMPKRDIGQEILEGVREIKAHKVSKMYLRTHTLKEPAPPQVIRGRAGGVWSARNGDCRKGGMLYFDQSMGYNGR